MKIKLGPSNRGSIIGIIVAIILLLLALFLIIYLLLALFRIAPRSFPAADNELYRPYLYEPIANAAKFLEPDAPEGMRFSSVPLLASTNLTVWEVVMCRVDTMGNIHAPDGTVLRLRGYWDEDAQEWRGLAPEVVKAGTNVVRIFRVP